MTELTKRRRALLQNIGEHIPYLPTEYQAIEYLEGTGTQWIDSEYTISTSEQIYSFRCDAKISDVVFVPNGYNDLIQARCGTLDRDRYFPIGARTATQLRQTISTQQLTYSLTPNTEYEVVYDIPNKYFKCGDVERERYDIGEQLYVEKPESIYFWSASGYGERTAYTRAKIHYVIFYENGRIVRYYVPCYRKSDGIHGMYELFRHNSSTTGTPFFINKNTKGGDFGGGSTI